MSSRKSWIASSCKLKGSLINLSLLRGGCCEGDGDDGEEEGENGDAGIHGG